MKLEMNEAMYIKGLKKAGEEIKEAGKTVGEAFGDFFN